MSGSFAGCGNSLGTVPKEKEYLIDIKRHIENGSIMPVERARELSDDSLENIRKVGDYFINSINTYHLLFILFCQIIIHRLSTGLLL